MSNTGVDRKKLAAAYDPVFPVTLDHRKKIGIKHKEALFCKNS